MKKCNICGKEFNEDVRNTGRQKYCSNECRKTGIKIYINNYMRKYRTTEKGRQSHNNCARNRWNRLRAKAIMKLGGKCVYCGCDDIKALELNHIYGGGYKDYGNCNCCRFYRDIIFGKWCDIEVTCKVCNAWHYLVKLKRLRDGWMIKYKKEKT